MLTHTVVTGDTLSAIAVRYGFEAGEWELIYNQPSNSQFRQLRPDPNLIEPGDKVRIPLSFEPQHGGSLRTPRG